VRTSSSWAGLSLGIEAAAHQAAVEAGGCTVAVLGTGVDVVYPLPNVSLADRIVSSGGALLSPFPDGTQPRAANFQRRNWTIAAIADLVVVVETTTASPVLVTVEAARALGKPVMAVPGSVFSLFSVGCHQLLRDGAVLVENGADILAALPAGPQSPASLNQADIRARLVQADCLRQDAHRRMLSAQSQPGSALPRDFDGRTPAEAYHYWERHPRRLRAHAARAAGAGGTVVSLTFGYNAGLPGDRTVAWGARLIVTQDGQRGLRPRPPGHRRR